MNPNLLTVYTSPFPKKRVGRLADGGYVIVDIPNIHYDLLIAAGINDDISFEEHFAQLFPNTPILAFDASVPGLPAHSLPEGRIRFFPYFIGDKETFKDGYPYTNLHHIINPYVDANNTFASATTEPNLFVKMDIEGGEIPWLQSLTVEQLNVMSQIVMEFHFPFGEAEKQVFEKLAETHLIVHFHGNNSVGTRVHMGTVMPEVFECTFLHKKWFHHIALLNKTWIPDDNVDVPNCYGKEDIYLGHPPFVHMDNFIRKL